jgi:DNA gyrase inhibitor GyrI
VPGCAWPRTAGPNSHAGTIMRVQIVERSPFCVWSVRLLGALAPGNIRETYSRLWQWQIAQGMAGRTKEAMGVCYGDYNGSDDAFRYYAGIVWTSQSDLSKESRSTRLRASTPAIGSWAPTTSSPQRSCNSMETSCRGADSYPMIAPALEIYRNNPMSTPESELIVDR